MTILADEAQEAQIVPAQAQLDLDDVFADALGQAEKNIEITKSIVLTVMQDLKKAQLAHSIAKKQLQNARLANGLNSDGTERKPRTKRTPPE